jgi:hypothetical protein
LISFVHSGGDCGAAVIVVVVLAVFVVVEVVVVLVVLYLTTLFQSDYTASNEVVICE